MGDQKIEIKDRIENIRKEFFSKFGGQKSLRFFKAPGRVNLIGEHTDYNGGFVLPAGINRSVIVCAGLNNKNSLRLYSLNFDIKVECPLNRIEYRTEDGWANYPKGVAKMLLEQGYKLKGMDIIFEGDIPIGSGLASSAALEVVSCFVLMKLSEIEMEKDKIPVLCQSAENRFIGMKCGIMDQFVITMCQKDCALFIDCQNLQYEHILINNPDYVFIISVSKVKRELINSIYNTRRTECEEGVKILKKFLKDIEYLRHVSDEQFSYHQDKLPEIVQKRCAHVIYENERVLRAREFLKKGMFKEFGILMNESHYSLKNLYEVSCSELDTLVEVAQSIKGVLGSRMTGAGFGGCIITLIERTKVREFIETQTDKYYKRFRIKPDFYECQLADGVKEVFQ